MQYCKKRLAAGDRYRPVRVMSCISASWKAALSTGMARTLPWLRYVPVLSEPGVAWQGRTGFVHRAVMADLPDLSGHQVYACGAPVMVAAAQRDLVAQCALPAEEFYADAFTSEADKHGA